MPVVSAARELTPSRDDTGLRTALRNVPLLPAPANVDDLLARLEAEDVRLSSGPLADLILDARHSEPAPADDGFFAPVALAANANRRSSVIRRSVSGLFAAALATGAFFIVWNALVAPDAAPPIRPSETARAPEGDALTPPAPMAAAEDPGPTPADVAGTPLPPADLPEISEASSPLGAAAVAEPVLEPLPVVPELVFDWATLAAGDRLASTEPAGQPEPLPAVSAEAIAEMTQPQAPAPPGDLVVPEPDQFEPMRDRLAPAETFVSLEPTAPAPATPAAPAPGEPSRADAAAPAVAVSEPLASEPSAIATPAPSTSEPIGTADASPAGEAAAAQAVEPAAETPSAAVALAAPEMVTTGAAESPQSDVPATAPPVSQEASAAADPVLAEPALPVKPVERVPFAGIWAANAEACSPAMQEEGHLLARIGAWGGRAGDTSCLFKTLRRKRNTWSMNAACSDGETSWRSNVRLSLSGGRLTWTSQKGSTTYMRCPRA